MNLSMVDAGRSSSIPLPANSHLANLPVISACINSLDSMIVISDAISSLYMRFLTTSVSHPLFHGLPGEQCNDCVILKILPLSYAEVRPSGSQVVKDSQNQEVVRSGFDSMILITRN